MERAGLAVHKNSVTEKITKDDETGKLTLHTKAGEEHGDFNVILMAVGEGCAIGCGLFHCARCRRRRLRCVKCRRSCPSRRTR